MRLGIGWRRLFTLPLIIGPMLVGFLELRAFAQSSVEQALRVQPQLGHSDQVVFAAVLPDGNTVVTASRDKLIKFWSIATGREIRTLSRNAAELEGIDGAALSPNGQYLATYQSQLVTLWDLQAGREVRSASLDGGQPLGLAFSPDGSMLAAYREYSAARNSSKDVRLLTVPDLRQVLKLSGAVSLESPLRFTPDGKALLADLNGRVSTWDINTGKRTSITPKPVEQTGNYRALFAPDGRSIAYLEGDRLRLCDVTSGRELKSATVPDSVLSISAFSPDGQSALLRTENEVVVWDVNAWTERLRISAPGGAHPYFGTFSRDGRTILAAVDGGGVKLWDGVTGAPMSALTGRGSSVASLAWSPDAASLAFATGGGVKIWDPRLGSFTSLLDENEAASDLKYSPDSRTILSVGRQRARLFDVGSRQSLRTYDNVAGPVAFSPDGRTFASGYSDQDRFLNVLKVWDVSTGSIVRAFTRDTYVPGPVAFSADGRTLFSGGGGLGKWDLASGRRRAFRDWSGGEVKSISLTPDGSMGVLGSWAGGDELQTWSTATTFKVRSFQSAGVNTVSFSPSATTFAAGDIEGNIKLWDTRSGRLLTTLKGHEGEVNAVSLSPDGKQIASGGADHTVRIWSSDGNLLATSVIDGNEWVTMTPEGFFTASAQGAQFLQVQRGSEVLGTIDQVYDVLHRPDLVREKLAGDPQGKVRDAAGKLDLTKAISSGAPPRVALRDPARGATTDTQIVVEGTMTDGGGGVGRVEWRVNGVTVGLETRGLGRLGQDEGVSRPASEPGIIALRQVLPLQIGENTIDLRVYNAAGLIASEPASVMVRREGVAEPPRLFVLAAGIDDYDDSALRLAFSAADAKALSDAMRKAGGKLYRSTEIMTLLNKEVTVAGLDAAFAEIAQKIGSDDVFVFYLAGHGKTVEGRYYFIPRDFRYDGETSFLRGGIGQDRWQVWLQRIRAQKSILLYDTCDSGTLTAERVASRGLEEKTALDLLTRATGRTTLTAASANQPALEGYRGHGVFTYALLEAIGQGDVNGDGFIDLDELILYVNKTVPEVSQRVFNMGQFPQVARNGGNFALAAQTDVLSGSTRAVIPRKPTHVVIAPADVYADAIHTGAVAQKLAPGVIVTVVQTNQGWTLIAKDGQQLGYVEEGRLVRIQ